MNAFQRKPDFHYHTFSSKGSSHIMLPLSVTLRQSEGHLVIERKKKLRNEMPTNKYFQEILDSALDRVTIALDCVRNCVRNCVLCFFFLNTQKQTETWHSWKLADNCKKMTVFEKKKRSFGWRENRIFYKGWA